MIPEALLRRNARLPWAIAGAAALAAAVAAAAGAELAGPALRAGAVLALLAAVAALVRRGAVRASAAPAPLAVEARQPFGRDRGIAVIRIERRRFVVGYGGSGVALLAELETREPPP